MGDVEVMVDVVEVLGDMVEVMVEVVEVMGDVEVTEIQEVHRKVMAQVKVELQVKVDTQAKKEVKTEDIMETVQIMETWETMEMEEIVAVIMEATEVEEILVTTDVEEKEEQMETTDVEEIRVTAEVEGTRVMEGIGVMEVEAKSKDALENTVQVETPIKVKITWMSIALLKSGMELLHPNMVGVSQASMGTALEESMEGTEVTNQLPRGVTIPPLSEVTTLPLGEVTILQRGEVTIRPRCVAITQLPRSHTEVMERTEATRQLKVTIQPRSGATIQRQPGNTTQRPNLRSMRHHRQRSTEDPRSMGRSRPRKEIWNRFEKN